MPSRRQPELVPDFAERLAKAAGLPYAAVLIVVKETEEQAKLENSRKQWLNVQGAFKAERGECPPGAALLVDDLVDSKWTITEAGAALRRAGVAMVVPLALAAGTSTSRTRPVTRSSPPPRKPTVR